MPQYAFATLLRGRLAWMFMAVGLLFCPAIVDCQGPGGPGAGGGGTAPRPPRPTGITPPLDRPTSRPPPPLPSDRTRTIRPTPRLTNTRIIPSQPTGTPERTITPRPKPQGCQRQSDCRKEFKCERGRCISGDQDTTSENACRGRTALQVLLARSNLSSMFLSNLRTSFGEEIINLLNDTRARLTVFAPTNVAFARARNGSSEVAIHANSECLKAALRLHIVLRSFNSSELVLARQIGTMQGWNITVSTAHGQTLPYLQVSSSATTRPSDRAQLIHHSNLPVCNGMVHFVNNLLVPRSMLPDTQQKSVVDAINAYPGLSDFAKVLKLTSIDALLAPPARYTIFAPTNSAFRTLGLVKANWSLSMLESEAQLRQLVGLIRSHVAPMPYTVVDLSRMANTNLPVLSLEGQLVNGSVRILSSAEILVHSAPLIQSNITASNGIIHIVDGVFSLQYPSNRCVQEVRDRYPGKCTSCPSGYPTGRISCAPGLPDIRLGVTTKGCGTHNCRYRECVNEKPSKIVTCCKGYYSSACLPCPGSNVANPCSGHGTCADGISGSGTCLCEPGYTGTACDTRITDSEANSVEPTFPPRAPERSGTGSQSDSDEDSETAKTNSHRSEYFLIPLSIGATLAVLVVVAGVVLWKMKRRVVSISETQQQPQQQQARSPQPSMPCDVQLVPGMPGAYVCRQGPGEREFVVVSPTVVSFHATQSGTTMTSIPEEEQASEEGDSPNLERQSLSDVSVSELVANQHPLSKSHDLSPADSLEATSSNELLDN
ncbi:stabilin-1-like [Sycon ciliatum]|uniref:stabilin-1-like n=1 Tax=Sycon ciliatum TaxID=27933 RepID=UPI0020AE1CF8|eukprot:scpid30294/ scgid17988/ Stabilin-1; Fasciclin, EGF-like, laminin-type EGF-like and link domain-containing scavenger receptor 1; MS-1 antigen